MASCGNQGDNNSSDLNSLSNDTSMGSRGSDTIQNPGPGGPTETSVKKDSLSHSGSNDQKNETIKDSSKTKQ